MENTKKMTLLCYAKCSTCQATMKELDKAEVKYETRDIKGENPSYEEMREWYQNSGLPLKKFFNTSGLLYKTMELKDKIPTMSDEEQLQLLATDGMLVKRPMMIEDNCVCIGKKDILERYS